MRMDSSDRFERSATTTRRRVLKAAGAGVGLTALGTTASTGQQPDYWTVVALPDTRCSPQRGHLTPRTRRSDRRHPAVGIIAFVSHVGDVVDHGDDDAEWQYKMRRCPCSTGWSPTPP